MCVCVYIYIYIYISKELTKKVEDLEVSIEEKAESIKEITDGTPDPNPKHLVRQFVFLTWFRQAYIFLNWLSGALVGVGGSDIIGYYTYTNTLYIHYALYYIKLYHTHHIIILVIYWLYTGYIKADHRRAEVPTPTPSI